MKTVKPGRPATELLSLTVVAPTLTEADATATAAFAMGTDGIEWAAARDGCEVFAVAARRRVFRTPGLPVAARPRWRPARRRSSWGRTARSVH